MMGKTSHMSALVGLRVCKANRAKNALLSLLGSLMVQYDMGSNPTAATILNDQMDGWIKVCNSHTTW